MISASTKPAAKSADICRQCENGAKQQEGVQLDLLIIHIIRTTLLKDNQAREGKVFDLFMSDDAGSMDAAGHSDSSLRFSKLGLHLSAMLYDAIFEYIYIYILHEFESYIHIHICILIHILIQYVWYTQTYLNSCSETPLKTHRKWWDLAVPPASGRHPAPGRRHYGVPPGKLQELDEQNTSKTVYHARVIEMVCPCLLRRGLLGDQIN